MLKISQTDSVSLTGQFTSSQAGFYAVSDDTEDASAELVGQWMSECIDDRCGWARDGCDVTDDVIDDDRPARDERPPSGDHRSECIRSCVTSDRTRSTHSTRHLHVSTPRRPHTADTPGVGKRQPSRDLYWRHSPDRCSHTHTHTRWLAGYIFLWYSMSYVCAYCWINMKT